ncbi:Ig-like domain-containing protein [Shewanella chilikensis]|uniref:Ig-like domain-containing protein n=1 Tax=Shewanella chilikensis TaxID=558541 RepID=UPI00399A558E
MKRKDVPLSILLALALTACGGGGDESSGNNGGSTTPPSAPNTAPVISGLSDTYQMMERTELSIPFTVTDAEADTITLSATSSNAAVTVSHTDNTLKLVATDISQTMSVTITLKANDGKTSSSKSFTLKVTNNQAPVISGLPDSYQMEENAQLTVPFTVTDAEGDTISVSATSSAPEVTVSHNGNSLLLVAGEIAQDVTSTITLTANDGQNSTHASFTLSITDKPVPTKAPVISWAADYGTAPLFAVNEKTLEDFVFTLSDEDSDITNITIASAVTVLNAASDDEKQRVADNFSLVVDKVTGVARATIPNVDGRASVAIVLTATDEKGNEAATSEMRLHFNQRDSIGYLDDHTGKYPSVGVSSTVSLFFISSNETNQTTLASVEYANPDYVLSDPLNINGISKSQFTITPTEAVAGELVVLKARFFIGEANGVSSYSEQEIKIKTLLAGSLEESWSQQIAQMNQKLKYAFEYQKIANYINHELFFSGNISSNDYITNARKIKLADYENIYKSAQYTNARYENAINQFMQQEEGMPSEIDNFIASQIAIFDAGVNAPSQSVTLVNQLINVLHPNEYRFDEQPLIKLDDGQYSRFIGNTLYGEYKDGRWQFTGKYQFLNSVLL